jgi:hypothetical protein
MKKTLTAAAATVAVACHRRQLPMTHASIKPIVGAFLGAVLQGRRRRMRAHCTTRITSSTTPSCPTGLERFIEFLPSAGEARLPRRKHPHVRGRQLCLHAQYLAQC